VIKQHSHVASPFNEFATFTIGPDISRLDWFKIRTKITSQFVDVSFIPPRRAHFLDRIPTSNVWGPRYGLVAESTRALISEGKDPRNQCPWCLERYMPYTTATDDERKAHIAEDHVYEILDLLPDNSGSGSSSDSEDDEDDDGGSDHGGAVSGLPQDVSMEDAVNPEPFPRFRAPSERQPSQRASASEENNGASEAAVNSRARTRDKGKGKAIAASDDSNSGQGDSNAVATSQRRTGNKRKRQAVDSSDGSDYNDGNGRDAAEQFAGASQAEASSSAQGRARATKKRARPAQARETEVLPSIPLPEPVEGTKQRRRREAEKNWVEELGPSDPDFVPGDGYRCSRCLRKVPSVVPPVNKGQQSGSNMPREEEIAVSLL
jgi:hypothetical protein